MRRKLIAGNWKMYKTVAEAVALVDELKAGVAGAPGDTLVAPPFTALAAVVAAAKGSPLAVAAQNMHFEKEGAFTGEVSAPMLLDAGVTHVILGHSERRQYFAETDAGVAKKTKVALDSGLVPISCVGETLAEREAGRTIEVVGRQLDAILDAVSADEARRVVVAYEPVWAIGTGKVATPDAGAGGPRLRPLADRREARQAGRGRAARALRRQRQARQRQGPDGPPRRGRRARRRRLAQGRLVPEARALRPGVDPLASATKARACAISGRWASAATIVARSL